MLDLGATKILVVPDEIQFSSPRRTGAGKSRGQPSWMQPLPAAGTKGAALG